MRETGRAETGVAVVGDRGREDDHRRGPTSAAADVGQRWPLFECDRDELRTQAIGKLSLPFGNEACKVTDDAQGWNIARSARVHVAAFQTLGSDKPDGTASFQTRHYGLDYFSHISVEECHRSAWGKWSAVLTQNQNAVHIGLTTEPRELKLSEKTPEAAEDQAITANNVTYFGEPVYEYTMGQATDDGFLAACDIVKATIDIDETGPSVDQVMELNPTDAGTGRPLSRAEVQSLYPATAYEQRIQLPDRVHLMCRNLFRQLIDRVGDSRQKSILSSASG